ncbi:MAG TPA: C25 family cysteine peptidase, partial [Bacteroidia bacterium]|nr:C25 family cysteine peptidase [Bacteroidia bacterium]
MNFSTRVIFLLLLLLPACIWAQSPVKQNPLKPAPANSGAVISGPVKKEPANPVVSPKINPVNKGQINLVWGKTLNDNINTEDPGRKFLNFKGASYMTENHFLPEYFKHIKLNSGSNNATVKIANAKYEPLTADELKVLSTDGKWVANDIVPTVKIRTAYNENFASIRFVPIRKNPVSGTYEKLVSFSLDIEQSKREAMVKRSPISFANNSVLSTGTWLRIGVTSDGVYKLNYSFFKQAGIDMSSLVPANIRVYGNGGAMLPQSNAAYRADDLLENAIFVNGQTHTTFQPGDYVLFYGQSPTVWTYNSSDKRFHHTVNLYSDTTYYFVNIDLGPGKRIGTESSSNTPTDTVTSFDDYAYHELDGLNLIQTGNQWFGEYFETTTQYTISFNFPNIVKTTPAYINAEVASRNIGCSTCYNYYMAGPDTIALLDVSGVFTAAYATMGAKNYTFLPSSTLVSTTISKLTTSAVGWLYFVEANARRSLSMPLSSNIYQMEFRDSKSVGSGNISLFNISSFDSIQVWDVTKPQNVSNVSFLSKSGGTYKFALPTDTLKQFVSFTQNGPDSTVTYFGRVTNQNLHADSDVDEIIVTSPFYYAQAEQLKNFHINHDHLRVTVATTQQVYNEFSSGRQDPTAIRDYAMMHYRRSHNSYANAPKYLLLFGDGSFDQKNRLSGNTNYVVAYES